LLGHVRGGSRRICGGRRHLHLLEGGMPVERGRLHRLVLMLLLQLGGGQREAGVHQKHLRVKGGHERGGPGGNRGRRGRRHGPHRVGGRLGQPQGQHGRVPRSGWGHTRRGEDLLGGNAARQHEVHVLATALENLYVALLFAEHHVPVVALLRGQKGTLLRVHLDERFAGRLTLWTLRDTSSVRRDIILFGQ